MFTENPRTGAIVVLPRPPKLAVSIPSAFGLANAIFIDSVTRNRFSHLREVTLRVGPDSAAITEVVPSAVLFTLRDGAGETAVLGFETGVASVRLSQSSGSATIAARTGADADALVARLVAVFDDGTPPGGVVPVTFWTAGRNSPSSARREISALAWSEVIGNYGRATADALSALMGAHATTLGRLVLWHGAPGSGKTTALRALSRAWVNWCDTHFITDPERFLGSDTGYLLEVLTARTPAERRRPPTWKLIVLEDAGEFLSAGAREPTAQALARLLNVTDGMLGQGTEVVLLITTNEPLRTLHPAVVRPGRCWATIEFSPLSADEANEWLIARNSRVRVTHPLTLAALYEVLRGGEPEVRRPFGFGVRADGA
jgi:hypothetical protein